MVTTRSNMTSSSSSSSLPVTALTSIPEPSETLPPREPCLAPLALQSIKLDAKSGRGLFYSFISMAGDKAQFHMPDGTPIAATFDVEHLTPPVYDALILKVIRQCIEQSASDQPLAPITQYSPGFTRPVADMDIKAYYPDAPQRPTKQPDWAREIDVKMLTYCRMLQLTMDHFSRTFKSRMLVLTRANPRWAHKDAKTTRRNGHPEAHWYFKASYHFYLPHAPIVACEVFHRLCTMTFDTLDSENFFGTGEARQRDYFDFAPLNEVKRSRSLMRLPYTSKEFVRNAQHGDGVHRLFKVLDDDGTELPLDTVDVSLLSIRPSTAQLLALMRGESDSYMHIRSSVAGEPYRYMATPTGTGGALEVRGPASTWLDESLNVAFSEHVVGGNGTAARRAVVTLSATNVMVAQLTYEAGDRCPITGHTFSADDIESVEATTVEVTTTTTTTHGRSTSSSSSSKTTTTRRVNVLRALVTFIDWAPKRDQRTGKWKANPGVSLHTKYHCEHCSQWYADHGTMSAQQDAFQRRYEPRPTAPAAAAKWMHRAPPTAALLVARFAPYQPQSVLALPLENGAYLNGLSSTPSIVAPPSERRCTGDYLRSRFKAHAVDWCRLGRVPLSEREIAAIDVQRAVPVGARYFSDAFSLNDVLGGDESVAILEAQCGAGKSEFAVEAVLNLYAMARSTGRTERYVVFCVAPLIAPLFELRRKFEELIRAQRRRGCSNIDDNDDEEEEEEGSTMLLSKRALLMYSDVDAHDRIVTQRDDDPLLVVFVTVHSLHKFDALLRTADCVVMDEIATSMSLVFGGTTLAQQRPQVLGSLLTALRCSRHYFAMDRDVTLVVQLFLALKPYLTKRANAGPLPSMRYVWRTLLDQRRIVYEIWTQAELERDIVRSMRDEQKSVFWAHMSKQRANQTHTNLRTALGVADDDEWSVYTLTGDSDTDDKQTAYADPDALIRHNHVRALNTTSTFGIGASINTEVVDVVCVSDGASVPLQTRLQAEERVRKIRGQPFEQRTIRLVLARKTEHKLRLDIMPTLANAVLHTNDELEQPSNALAVRGDDPVSLLMAFSRAITRPRTGQAIVLRAIIAEHDLHDGGKQQVRMHGPPLEKRRRDDDDANTAPKKSRTQKHAALLPTDEPAEVARKQNKLKMLGLDPVVFPRALRSSVFMVRIGEDGGSSFSALASLHAIVEFVFGGLGALCSVPAASTTQSGALAMRVDTARHVTDTLIAVGALRMLGCDERSLFSATPPETLSTLVPSLNAVCTPNPWSPSEQISGTAFFAELRSRMKHSDAGVLSNMVQRATTTTNVATCYGIVNLAFGGGHAEKIITRNGTVNVLPLHYSAVLLPTWAQRHGKTLSPGTAAWIATLGTVEQLWNPVFDGEDSGTLHQYHPARTAADRVQRKK